MDRMLKKADLVHVYQSRFNDGLLATFEQKPYTYAGYDNYKYRGQMYKGFINLETMTVHILLDQPLFKEPPK